MTIISLFFTRALSVASLMSLMIIINMIVTVVVFAVALSLLILSSTVLLLKNASFHLFLYLSAS